MFVERECDRDAGFTDSEKVAISRALDIDSRLCECELYCFATNCKVARGEQVVQRSDIVKAWDSIPRTFKQSSREDHADSCCPLVMLFGASPRSSTKLLNGTHVHPQLLDMLVSLVRHHAPQFFFTTIALRLDSRKPPHRDIRNGPFGTFFQVLTENIPGRWHLDSGCIWAILPSAQRSQPARDLIPSTGVTSDFRRQKASSCNGALDG